MAKLEDLTQDSVLKGILPNESVTVIGVRWYGSDTIELTYKDIKGKPHTELILRDQESTLELISVAKPWSFDGDGALLRLVSEAHRIRLAYLFDPLLAVHTSLVEPLPHQITAVYGEMLNRQPLRFLLADDPGAGKTIMAGLLIRELLIRGDLARCLIVCPGSLAVQWQDELHHKFYLPFDILTNDRIEAARTGNAFAEMGLVIARLDKLSRNDDLQEKLQQTDWDLVICDEAHKMSASFFGGEIRETKRYKLGKLLSSITRHFLLMTATPHNGKEEDFQLFLALLDGDRFEGRFRDGVHVSDTSDLMRRMVKEELLKFDGKPLFPERIAHTVSYPLSDQEAILYRKVTDYVREEFNRAEALSNDGRKGTVGFALTILQRRLASSPEAIYQSLKRRRERLQKRLREEELLKRGQGEMEFETVIDQDNIDDDFEYTDSTEREATVEEVVDQATAARTIAELQVEIALLKELEDLANTVRRSGKDRKWEEFSHLLQDEAEMFDVGGYRRKIVVFTEHRDTLNYLRERISTLIGNPKGIVTIHGAMVREDRKKAEEDFKQDIGVQVLLATDAAGEGINLQRAHLMVNYDLPWNPNRLEQRFGRIHRIGQTDVCHLWNLVAHETREGDVYRTLLEKLEAEQKALGGRVFDVLGKAIAGKELRELLIEAIRYGDRPEVKARLNQVVAEKLDQDRLRELLEDRSLARDSMDASKVEKIRQDMDRAEARRLQPHFIAAFFLEAFQYLGGTVRQRETRRYEITYVPALLRSRDRPLGMGQPILKRYERICFDKELISISGKPVATFVCPGHPLLDTTIDLILEQHRELLRRGAVLIDETDPNEEIRALVYLEHEIQDARLNKDGTRRVVSKQMQYVEIDAKGTTKCTGYAPYLDYRPLEEGERILLEPILNTLDIGNDIESKATSYAIARLVPSHFQQIKQRKEELIEKTQKAVKDRLTKEINYWDHRASQLQLEEQAGKTNARLNSKKAQTRADELVERLDQRQKELEQEKKLSPLPPVVLGAALIVPGGLIGRLSGKKENEGRIFAKETKRIEKIAMEAVMEAEKRLGYEPRDVSDQKCGYDIESHMTGTGRLRFIEVKGRVEGADTVTVTKNEILVALNKPEDFLLALVSVSQSEELRESGTSKVREAPATCKEQKYEIRYIWHPFHKEPDFDVSSVNYKWEELWAKGLAPKNL
ncbi:helicase-related protein [Cylindrospermopsis raciborskii]|uniref:helicase-related protein n=1 Tax=Cylindrospermopsis raciborskii TaxID=77022 RepID=UPI0022C42827|nr:helicase-related protein [Cylindrospermopsis raciborskii]MCZ2207311.1 helicase-related protein [Cylindrospermopsis raciborskii PAMP2011]